MMLYDLAKVICVPRSQSELIHITVRKHVEHGEDTGEVLWEGLARDLKYFTEENDGWIVVEILIDRSVKTEVLLPSFNKSKIITVI